MLSNNCIPDGLGFTRRPFGIGRGCFLGPALGKAVDNIVDVLYRLAKALLFELTFPKIEEILVF